ncbi:CD209 antigen-like isoform X2 [Anolis carolinensis]|uniref:CD209 antigen-like isoform X2 n=1 Tax=Anolis carolinensis TaxID=28377 RepID=UPI002F2B2950
MASKAKALAKPAVDKPAVDKPAVAKTALAKPTVDKPAADEPAADKPAVDKPAVAKTALAKTALAKPAAAKPAVDKPAADEPAVDKPAMDKPAAVEPAAAKPAAMADTKGKGGKARAKETAQKIHQRTSAMATNFPFNMASPKKLWTGLQVAAAIGVIVFIISISIYIFLTSANKLRSIEKPMNHLKHTMSIGMRNRNMNYANYARLSNEVVKLPSHIENTQREYGEQKKKYRALFNKETKSVNGWDIFGNNLYYISKSKKSWFDAENFCQSRDSHLASILTNEEQNYIAAQIVDPFWIGLTDENVEGHWEWSDGSEVTTEDWAGRKQNFSRDHEAAEKDCAFVEHSPGHLRYSWKDGNCYGLKRWVCKEAITVTNDKFNQGF